MEIIFCNNSFRENVRGREAPTQHGRKNAIFQVSDRLRRVAVIGPKAEASVKKPSEGFLFNPMYPEFLKAVRAWFVKATISTELPRLL
jgi:hypothetical protein